MLKRILIKFLKKTRRERHDVLFSQLGVGCEISRHGEYIHPDRLRIGNYVHIEDGVFINATGGVEIQDHTIIGPDVLIMSSLHRHRGASLLPYDEIELLRAVVLEKCVWIGSRAIILAGVRIMEGSIVGAGAVVTKTFPAGSILGGNPAVVIGTRDMAEYQRLSAEGQFYLTRKQQLNLQKKETRDD